MSFEYLIEEENNIKKLSQADENELVKKIVEDYKTFNDKRADNLQKSKKE